MAGCAAGGGDAGGVCAGDAAGGFFWDDYELIVNNPLVHSPGGLRDFWFSTKNFDYFPLTSTTFWIEWRVWGNWAQPYHVLNVLLHLGSALMLWRIFRELKVPGAFWGAAAVCGASGECGIGRVDHRAEEHVVDVSGEFVAAAVFAV